MRLGRIGLFGLCAATFVVLACGQDVQQTHEQPAHVGHVGKTSQDLIAQPETYTGADLPAKTLVFTFDDGPGPATFTNALSAYLKAQGIKATFFVNGACVAATALAPNGSCDPPTPNAGAILAQLVADGHMIANHTTTHRDMASGEVPDNQRVQEITETDTAITPYVNPNRLFFRAPYGSWNAAAFNTINASAMKKYIGPIYWVAGGGPTAANLAADWECWQVKSFTTKQCGDRYVTEIKATGSGIVLMHDAKCGPANCNNLANTNINAGIGNTLDMVKYIVPLLKADGYTFTTLEKVPSIAAVLPAIQCNAACATCSGPAANECTGCAAGKFLSGGTCAACTTCAIGNFAKTACASTADTVCAACTACGKSFYQTAACSPTADATCAACDASCTACAGPNKEDCGKCPEGYFLSGAAGAGGECKACTLCAAGTFQAEACGGGKDTTCTACGNGTFSDAPAAVACKACAEGTFAAQPGATKCEACNNCDDANACTKDSCSTAAGCIHELITPCDGPGGSSGDAGDAGVPVDGGGDDSGCSTSRRRSSPTTTTSVVLLGLAMLAAARRRRCST